MPNLFSIEDQPILLPDLPGPEAQEQGWVNLFRNVSLLEDQLKLEGERALKEYRAILIDVLEVNDALDRICDRLQKMAALSSSEERLKGNIEATRRLLLQKLLKAGVQPIHLIRQPLDTRYAEVVDYEVREELPDETVLQEHVKGYLWNDEVLRPARVVISRQEE